MDVVVVYNKKTRKLLPFKINDLTGEVILFSSGAYTDDNIVVGKVDARRLDLFNGYILPEGEINIED